MKTIFLILFFSITLSQIIYSQNNNADADTTIYFIVPQMPVYYGNYEESLKNVFEKIDKETLAVIKTDTININIQVTSNGKVLISKRNRSLPEFEKSLEEELNKLVWIPGKSIEKNVTVQGTSPVRIIDHKLIIPLVFKRVKGKLVKCKIINEQSGEPIPNVRLLTKYNSSFYYSDKNGEVSFYCEPQDEISIIHLNYLPFTFKAPEDKNAFQIKLNEIAYELNSLDLSKYSPGKLPYKKRTCIFEDWNDTITGSIVFVGSKDVFPPHVVKFKSIVFIGMESLYIPEEAEFNGGMECFYNYLASNFSPPENSYRKGHFDAVNIAFTITEDGSVTDLELAGNADSEIILSLKSLFLEMPKWKPATQLELPIKQYFTIQLNFGRNNYWDKLYR